MLTFEMGGALLMLLIFAAMISPAARQRPVP
jgi:hypothetical protein